jgi:hypothetical protein
MYPGEVTQIRAKEFSGRNADAALPSLEICGIFYGLGIKYG